VTDTYKRFKYWFQEEDLTNVPENSAVVVAMFRNPYDWVEAMRIEPLHAHDHLRWYQPGVNGSIDIYVGINDDGEWNAGPLAWKEFVTKPWIGQRRPKDSVISRTNRGMNRAKCVDSYSFYDAVPCSVDDSSTVDGLGEYKYEYKRDRSERGFSSIIDLRREKILNHLSVSDFRGTRAFLSFRFEDMNDNGMVALIKSLEEATGMKARCTSALDFLVQQNTTDLEELPEDYIEWMDRFVDWDVESRIGYSMRGGEDSLRKNMLEAEQDHATTTTMKEPSTPTEPVKQIVLLGERHSGTNWITDHLTECFDIKVSFWSRLLFTFCLLLWLTRRLHFSYLVSFFR
jgi:hypothetical protein